MSNRPDDSSAPAAAGAESGRTAPTPLSAAQAEVLAQLAPGVLYAAEQDMWVRQQPDGMLQVGATHIVAAHGQFMLFTPRPEGTQVVRDQSLGVMETAKTAVAIHAPVSGRLREANAAVVADVDLVTREPYGAGWLFVLQPTNWDAERGMLLDAAAYADWLAPRLAQKLAGPVDDDLDASLYIDPSRGY